MLEIYQVLGEKEKVSIDCLSSIPSNMKIRGL